MKFGDYIRQKREKAGWTQPEAAARGDIEQSYLSKLETGKSYPSEEVFQKLVQTFDLDVKALSDKITSDELNKLREISEVRTTILTRQKTEARFMRGWLLAGLVMLMIGGGALGLTNVLPDWEQMMFHYRSEGVIKSGESPMIYPFLAVGQQGKDDGTLSERVDYDYVRTPDYRGDSFIEPVENGYRKYTLFNDTIESEPSPLRWLFAPGIMFILGGLGCFYVARRWR